MENERKELAEKLEKIGKVYEIEGLSDLLGKIEPGINNAKFNGIVIQIEGLLLKTDKALADEVLTIANTPEEVAQMDDHEYAKALRSVIITDVLGFFG